MAAGNATTEWRPLEEPLSHALTAAAEAALEPIAAGTRARYRVVDLQTADETTFMRALRLDMGRGNERFLSKLAETICLARLFGSASVYAVFDDPFIVALAVVRTDGSTIELLALAVEEEYQNRRIGSAVLGAAVRALSTDGRTLTTLVEPDNYRSLITCLRAGFDIQPNERLERALVRLNWTGVVWPPPVDGPRVRVDVVMPKLCREPGLQVYLRVSFPHVDMRVVDEPPADAPHDCVLVLGGQENCSAQLGWCHQVFDGAANLLQQIERDRERLRGLRDWTHVCDSVLDLHRFYNTPSPTP